TFCHLASHPFVCLSVLVTPFTTHIYTLSLHDALPILALHGFALAHRGQAARVLVFLVVAALLVEREEAVELDDLPGGAQLQHARSEEHTSELQSRFELVCRLLL